MKINCLADLVFWLNCEIERIQAELDRRIEIFSSHAMVAGDPYTLTLYTKIATLKEVRSQILAEDGNHE